jgi:hypothetical protein
MSLRTLAFGDLETGIWGALWELGDGQTIAVFGDASAGAATTPAVTLAAAESEGTWTVSGDGVALDAAPEGDASTLSDGFDQLVRVTGGLTLEGRALEVDCVGRRSARQQLEPTAFESIREVSAWFGPELGLSVLAARPRDANSHADDLIAGSVLDQGHPLRVVDPRLSTTYKAGLPIRSGLELWLERQPTSEDEDEDPDAESYELRGEPVEHFPRRAAGEAAGSRGDARDGSLELHAELFRWHSRGREGAGVYLLARVGEHAG